MADYLSANGVAAEPAWSGRERTALTGPKAVVSVRKCQVGPAGFQDYLGERFDEDSGQWRELYGRKAELTLGLDLYAPEETEGAELERAVFTGNFTGIFPHLWWVLGYAAATAVFAVLLFLRQMKKR